MSEMNDIKTIRAMAEQGFSQGQLRLGLMYFAGQGGVPKDEAKAAEWFYKAAMQGEARAQFYMGLLHSGGQGVALDNTKAAEWFNKAANQGDADAQYELALLYTKGQGVPEDGDKAFELINKAAANGSEAAKKLLTKMKE